MARSVMESKNNKARQYAAKEGKERALNQSVDEQNAGYVNYFVPIKQTKRNLKRKHKKRIDLPRVTKLCVVCEPMPDVERNDWFDNIRCQKYYF